MLLSKSARLVGAFAVLVALLLCQTLTVVQAAQRLVAAGGEGDGAICHHAIKGDGESPGGSPRTPCDSARAVHDAYKLSVPAIAVASAVVVPAPERSVLPPTHQTYATLSGAPPPLHLLLCRIQV